MGTELQLESESFDYRTELLSPALPRDDGSGMRVPSWRINFDEFQVAEKQKDSDFGVGKLVKTISMYDDSMIKRVFVFLSINHFDCMLFLFLVVISLLFHVNMICSGKQKLLADYYKKQEKLLEGFNEVDAFTELGVLPGTLTEVWHGN